MEVLMILGVKFQIHPSKEQRILLSQWMGAQRFIWNAKVEEERYLRSYARKYLPVGTYPEADQSYSQYISKDICPWIYTIPSQILRNAAVRWYGTFKRFLSGECGRPRIKIKKDQGSVYITRELFSLRRECESVLLHLGTNKNSLGLIRVNAHRDFQDPASITIKRTAGRWTLSFSYGDEESGILDHQKACLSLLKDHDRETLETMVVGIDRGIAVSIQAGAQVFHPEDKARARHDRKLRTVKKMQKRLARQKKGSNQQKRTKRKIARVQASIRNVRHDFIHKATFDLCSSEHKVFILEDLQVRNMSKAPKPKPKETGKGFAPNGSKRKAGLNRSILDQAWSKFETILAYKSRKFGKVHFKVSPQFSSQECVACGHIHPDNRPSQADFSCVSCGHRDNADHNAAMVLKKRAIGLILDSGTELSARGVLTPKSGIGRGASRKTRGAKATLAEGNETSKKRKSKPGKSFLDPAFEALPLQG
jgi:putative transposase